MLFKMAHKGRVYKFFQYSLGAGLVTSSEYYPNPETWNPHNFDAEIVAQRPTYTFIPFALGLRQCVAKELSTNLLQIFNDQSRLLVDEIEQKGLGVEFSLWTFNLLANYYQELFPVTFLLASEQTNCLPGKASEQLPGIFRPVLAQDYQSW
ncbi:hypothetical protein V9T40_001551 [Parthenolecanium corni]|uniref:Cytochrome P450 n=1 Tax=Parthenolecanium corni TaxID=536013 RepID=A0AAN9TKF1_9HEMI